MLDMGLKAEINKWEMISLQTVFEEAVSLVAEEFRTANTKHALIPPVFVDCGNTLFDKAGEVPTIRPNFLNFLIALKNGGYDIQLISDEPLNYIDIVRDELRARGQSHRLFEDESGLTILRKQLANSSVKGLLLIDNDIFSIPIRIKRRIFPTDPNFIRALEAYADPATPLAHDMRADVLRARFISEVQSQQPQLRFA